MTDMIQELIEELGKSTAYTEEFDSEVKVIQTAISVVFLAGNFAYKISKPVDFGFLDFTTPLYSSGLIIELNETSLS